jgi:hypothetical protein
VHGGELLTVTNGRECDAECDIGDRVGIGIDLQLVDSVGIEIGSERGRQRIDVQYQN